MGNISRKATRIAEGLNKLHIESSEVIDGQEELTFAVARYNAALKHVQKCITADLVKEDELSLEEPSAALEVADSIIKSGFDEGKQGVGSVIGQFNTATDNIAQFVCGRNDWINDLDELDDHTDLFKFPEVKLWWIASFGKQNPVPWESFWAALSDHMGVVYGLPLSEDSDIVDGMAMCIKSCLGKTKKIRDSDGKHSWEASENISIQREEFRPFYQRFGHFESLYEKCFTLCGQEGIPHAYFIPIASRIGCTEFMKQEGLTYAVRFSRTVRGAFVHTTYAKKVVIQNSPSGYCVETADGSILERRNVSLILEAGWGIAASDYSFWKQYDFCRKKNDGVLYDPLTAKTSSGDEHKGDKERSHEIIIFNELEAEEDVCLDASVRFRNLDFDKLQHVRKIGQGKFGLAFVADYEGVNVVIKAPKNEPSKDEEAELSILMNLLPSPNVLQFVGTCPNFRHRALKGKSYRSIVVEYQKNKDIGKYLRRVDAGGLEDKQYINIVLGMFRGVAHLHKNNIIHRDIALRNNLVSDVGRILTADFGLSREVIGSINPETNEYMAASYYTAVGTLLPWRWCAPETLIRQKSSKKSDIWMLGVTILEIFELPPFRKTLTPLAHVANIGSSTFKIKMPEKCPPVLRTIAELCCQNEPARRPSAKDVIDNLMGRNPDLDVGVSPRADKSTPSEWSQILEMLDDAEDNEPPLISEVEAQRFQSLALAEDKRVLTIYKSCQSVQDEAKKLKRFARSLKRIC